MIKPVPIQITARKDGSKESADLITCGECGGATWNIYFVHDHQHIQCLGCASTYCAAGGDCGIEGLQSFAG
jgi:ribosomal protein S27E